MRILVIALPSLADIVDVDGYINRVKNNVKYVYQDYEIDVINYITDLTERRLETLSAISKVDYDGLIVDGIGIAYIHGMLDYVLSEDVVNNLIDYERIEKVVHEHEEVLKRYEEALKTHKEKRTEA